MLHGHVFQAKGRRWCVEAVTVVDAEGRLGVYAFDADAHTEATQLLTERCTVFGAEWIDKLQEQRRAQQQTSREAKRRRDTAGGVGASASAEPAPAAPPPPPPPGGGGGPQENTPGLSGR